MDRGSDSQLQGLKKMTAMSCMGWAGPHLILAYSCTVQMFLFVYDILLMGHEYLFLTCFQTGYKWMIQNSPTSKELRTTWTMWLCKGLQKCLKWANIILEEINRGTAHTKESMRFLAHTMELVELNYLYAHTMEFSYKLEPGNYLWGGASVSNNYVKLFYTG